jgi:RHS repeat-associated protein
VGLVLAALAGSPHRASAATAPNAEASAPAEGFSTFTHWKRDAAGHVTKQLYLSPQYRRSGSSWTAVDPAVRATGSASQPYAAAGAVRPIHLGSNASNIVQLDLDKGPVTMSSSELTGSTPQMSGGAVVYANAARDTDLRYAVSADGLQEWIILRSANAPTQFRFHIADPSGQLGGVDQQADGSYRFRTTIDGDVAVTLPPALAYAEPPASTGGGATVLATPLAADGTSAHLTVTAAGNGYDVTIAVDPAWLAGKKFPIVLDPTVNFSDSNGNILAGADGYYSNATAHCPGCYVPDTNGNLVAGTDVDGVYDPSTGQYYDAEPERSFYRFDLTSIPQGSSISSASFNQYTVSCFGYPVSPYFCNQHNYTVELHRMDGFWNSQTIWNNLAPLTDASVLDSVYQPAFNITSGCGGCFWMTWSNLGSAVQGWVNDPNTNNGFTAKLQTEAYNIGGPGWAYGCGDPNAAQYCGYPHPYLQVTYTLPGTPQAIAGLGEQRYYTMEKRQLNDRAQLEENVASGNLVYHSTDLHIKGTGLDLSVDRFYNSEAYGKGSFGNHWSSNLGPDVNLVTYSDGSVTFNGPSGYQVVYTPITGGGYTAPTGIDADLIKNSDGSYTIFWHHNGQKYNFTSAGQLTSEVDQNGNKLSLAYNSDGSLASVTDTQGRVTTFAYAGSPGLITSITDSSGRVTKYGYDDHKQLISYTDAAGNVTQYADDGSYNLSYVKDPLSETATLGYDGSHRSTTLSFAGQSSPSESESLQYNSGNTVFRDGDGNNTTYYYDAQDRVTKVVDALGNQQSATYTPDSNVQQYTDASGGQTNNAYDTNNNLTSTQQTSEGSQAGALSTLAYSNSSHPYYPTQYTEPQGTSFAFSYDNTGNLNSDQISGQSQANLSYNGNGTVASSTDGNGNKTTYGYDSNGNLTSITHPAPLGAESFTYDGLSRVASATDGKGQKTTYSYDALDRLTQASYADSSTVTRQYDADGNLTQQVNSTGNVTSTFTYDPFNNQASKKVTTSLPGISWEQTNYTYDAENNLASLADSSGTVSYAYNAVNLPATMTDQTGTTISYQYDAKYNRTSAAYTASGASSPFMTVTSTYDGSNRLTRTTTKNGSGGVLADFSYSYTQPGTSNDTNRRYSVTDVSGNTTSYTYDGSDRLTEARTTNSSGSQTADYRYTYDGNGNRTSQTVNGTTTSYTYNAANELNGSTFDADGNQLSNTAGMSATYNAKNQTASVTPAGLGSKPANMAYAGMGQDDRLQAGNTTYHNNKLGLSIAYSQSLSAAGIVLTSRTDYYTRDPRGNLVGEWQGATTMYYDVSDGLGSVVAVTNNAGSAANTYQYDPFGQTVASSGNVQNPWQFAGQYRDASGLYKIGARYYDASSGRWTQQDSVVDPFDQHESNRYDYVGDDPVNLVDPRGSCAWWDLLLGADTTANGLFQAVFGVWAIEASLELEVPSFGLSTIGVFFGVVTTAGGIATAGFGGYEFFAASGCF